MRAVVLDASVLWKFVLNAQGNPDVAELVRDEECEVFVPRLCDVEVASALRSALARGALDPDRVEEALQLYKGMHLERIEHLLLLSRILSLRDNFTAYDATYVALAEAAGAALHTADRRLARAVREHTAVEVVEV